MVVCAICLFAGSVPARADAPEPPTVAHGFQRVLRGIVVEFPSTLQDAPDSGPPVVGLLVGLLAAPVRAIQAVVGGLTEMVVGLLPRRTE